jgi:hypothetical protein
MTLPDLARLAAAPVLALALAAAPAAAEPPGDWDADADGALSREEFAAGMDEGGVFDDWDADASGALDRDEFYEGFYSAYDADDDEELGEDEWRPLQDDAEGGLFD